MNDPEHGRLLRLFPRSYRQERGPELCALLSEVTTEGGRPEVREMLALVGLAVRVWSLRLTGLEGRHGLEARRLLGWLLPSAMIVPIVGWLTVGLWSRLHGWPMRLTSDDSWRAWACWSIALILLALGRRRAAGVVAAVGVVLYLVVLVHFALRNNPRTVVNDFGWMVLQISATLALLTSPASPPHSTSRSPRAQSLAPAVTAAGLVVVAAVHAMPSWLWLFGHANASALGWLVATVGLTALAISPAGRLAMPVIAFATVDFVVARTVVTGLGDYGPSYPGWAHLQWTDVLALTVAPLVAYVVVRACLAVLTRDADAAVPSAG